MATTIISVIDTREYEEIGDRMKPVAGSGDLRDCDRCGRAHEVHARVRYDDGREAVVGTGCMGLDAAVARNVAASATTVARHQAKVARLRLELARQTQIRAEVEALSAPAPVRGEKTLDDGSTVGTVTVGDGHAIWLTFAVDASQYAERVRCAVRSWQDKRVQERGGNPNGYAALQNELQHAEALLARAQAKLARTVGGTTTAIASNV